MTELDIFLKHVLVELAAHYRAMESQLGEVKKIEIAKNIAFRHKQYTDSLVCYIKGIKCLSTLNACLVLLENGCVQEINSLCRIANDLIQEIQFLQVEIGATFTADQTKFTQTFFQEEFEDANQPILKSQKRESVSVRKISAHNAKMSAQYINPSDYQTIAETEHKVFSGYVHGAYPQIMDMYGGNPPHFHVFGMLGTPRIEGARQQIVIHIERLCMATSFVSTKLNAPTVKIEISKLLKRFDEETGNTERGSASDLLKKLKKQKSK